MKWNNRNHIGIKSVDNQHKKITDTVNKINHLISKHDSRDNILRLLKLLIQYTQHHFNEEESIMETIGYPDIREQKEAHKKLLGNMKDFFSGLTQETSFNSAGFLNTLTDWLDDHIIQEDSKISAYLTTIRGSGYEHQSFYPVSAKKELSDKLGKLNRLKLKGLITQEEYSSKKYFLVNDFLSLHLIESSVLFEKYFDLLEELHDITLFTENEKIKFQKILLRICRLKTILSKMEGNTEKNEFIDSFVDKKIITQQEAVTLKKNLIGSIKISD
jgi:hemerythrin-like metal-binding protein